jgi:hypothetical protein
MDFIPFKIYLDKTILNDTEMTEDLGNYIAIEFIVPGDSNIVILSKEDLTKEDEDKITENAEVFLASISYPEGDDEYIN